MVKFDLTKKPIVDTECFIVLRDNVIPAKTDQDGYLEYTFQNIGNYKIII